MLLTRGTQYSQGCNSLASRPPCVSMTSKTCDAALPAVRVSALAVTSAPNIGQAKESLTSPQTAGLPVPGSEHSSSSLLLPGLLPAAASVPVKNHSPALVVFSGGTAFNSVAGHMRSLTTRVAHVLPVSDDGGSTAEVVRVLGGPAVGDIRSRCLRLADDSDEEAHAVKKLLGHRLNSKDSQAAKQEWYSIVEGEHTMWSGVSEPYKHVIRSFLVHFHTQILMHSTERFNFQNGSIGNFFFAGARTFFKSLEAAIFLFSRVARLPEGSLVLPAICTEERITLGAELEDGTVLRGQNNISHPCTSGNVSHVDKSNDTPLPSAVRRVFYLSSEGNCQEHEVLPEANSRVIQHIETADAIVYGMGSLYTSICPTLCLNNMGEAISRRQVPKIMILNGSHDRETSTSGAHEGPMTAVDMVQAVTDALNRRRNRIRQPLKMPCSKYVTGLIVPKNSSIAVDRPALKLIGIQNVLEVDTHQDEQGRLLYEPVALVQGIKDMLAEQKLLPHKHSA